jgi:hypothetical protein
VYYAAGSPIYDPGLGRLEGTYEWFNLMRGMRPDPYWPMGIPFYFSSTYASSHGIVSPYALSGDPVIHQGWIDGLDYPEGDRRIVNIHGPITLNLHDTAEVIVALIAATGDDNVSSITQLKYRVGKPHQFLFHGAPIAGIAPVKKTYTVNSVVQFTGYATMMRGQIENQQFFIQEKPASSTSELVVTDPMESHIQVDVPGTYRIAFTAAANGMFDTASVEFKVVANRPPVASFTLSPTSVCVGDTLFLDGTPTNDPDGDHLKYGWSITRDHNSFDLQTLPFDSLHSVFINSDSARAVYLPLRACRILIALTVSDSFFTDTRIDTFLYNRCEPRVFR